MKPRHILSLSGGKDSAALAIFMRDRVPEMEYIFNDTGKELPETYAYLERISDYLGRPVKRLNADKGFDHWYDIYGRMIPSNHRRWCTKMLKLKPFEDHIGNDLVLNYIGIRADEARKGYISTKPNITPVYPFIDEGMVYGDIVKILEHSGVGMPPYTQWGRSRSGCYFCFYQQKIEWVKLLEKYPDLYEKAAAYEVPGDGATNVFTWARGESLESLRRPERVEQIKAEAAQNAKRRALSQSNLPIAEVIRAEMMDAPEEDPEACVACRV